ncbi:MAG TPA: phosphatidate cytidylyltransferase [Gemmatimonadaceae bacterium]|nr:phosphatidate cytidylyltransferase [Gemmatimonadaceae bacterium]
MSELAKRTVFSVIAAPLAVVILWFGDAPLAALLATIAALGAWEFYRIADAGGVRSMAIFGIVASALAPLFVHADRLGYPLPPPSVLLLLPIGILAASIWTRGVEGRPLSASATTLFGIFYTGVMLSFGYLLRYHQYTGVDRASGASLVALPMIITWASDTGAYFVGRALGRHKLIPRVSPGKTVEGAIGGMVLSMLVSWLYVEFVLRRFGQLGMRPHHALLFGAAISIAAQIGDLAESLLKREAGVKDSSRIIPGHGGILDRFDSLLFVLPTAYVLLTHLRLLVPAPR